MTSVVTAGELAALVRPGQSIYVAGGLTPPSAFVEALQRNTELSRDLHITSTITPGFPNPFDFDRLHPTATLTGPLMDRAFAVAQQQGRYRMLPLTFAGFLRHLKAQTFDLGVVQVAPPDVNGNCSFGPSVEFLPAALERCRRIVAVVNPMLPSLSFAATVPAKCIDAMCEAASAVPNYGSDTDDGTETIGRLIAQMVEDASTVQMGLGKVPAAMTKHLTGHRRLKIHSGMVSDGLMDLVKAGALDEGSVHTVAVAAGSQAFYDWLPQARGLRIDGCGAVYASDVLAKLEQFVAVNSALEVDLFGQCNLEHLAGRAVSGAGGGPDFARVARACRGGLSVVALNATFGREPQSRIVPALGPGAVVSLSRLDVDVVVTEFGLADLRVASVNERARSLIGVAAPQFRGDLESAWAALSARL